MYDTYRHFSELVAIFGSALCNPYFIKMGGENMGVGAIFGSDFHKSAMNSWQEGRDDKSGVALTTLLPHQLYNPFFSPGERYKTGGPAKEGQVAVARGKMANMKFSFSLFSLLTI